jgi:hypothetical protein
MGATTKKIDDNIERSNKEKPQNIPFCPFCIPDHLFVWNQGIELSTVACEQCVAKISAQTFCCDILNDH